MVRNTQQSSAWLQFRCGLTDNPPNPGEVGYTTAVYVPFFFLTSDVGIFYVP